MLSPCAGAAAYRRAALEQIEDKCLRLYRREIEGLGASNRVVVERVLLPAQWLSSDTISALLNFLH